MTNQVILGIESSCDDTAAAIVAPDGNVLSSVTASQHEIHAPHGGVYPEFASRAHVRSIIPAIHQTLHDAHVGPRQLRAIGVTRGPGLIGSLLVGINTATGLGLGWNVPVIGINHLRGHLRSADLEQRRVIYPATILLVSGGHSLLAHMHDSTRVEVLGTTRDDSVGEAYDKVGRLLGLPYPAGPAMDSLAAEGIPTIEFPRPMLRQGLEFSFSGLKAAVARYVERGSTEKKANIAASFVQAALDVLMTKCARALEEYPSRSLVIVGGVAASPPLRARAQELCERAGVSLCLPPLKWATDNAAMIALATYDYLEQGQLPRAEPNPNLPLWDY